VTKDTAERRALERTPEAIGPFLLGRRLGTGGAGVVFEAVHAASGAKVALKTVTAPSAWARASLRQEIAVLRSLDHAGVVRILDDGLREGGVWYAMELLEGGSLADWHRELWPTWPGPVSPVGLSRGMAAGGRLYEVLRIYADLCRALDFVHARGIVHGDLKPENVFVRTTGQPVLVDFGLSRYAESVRARLETGVAGLGSLCYAAPERLAGEHPDPRSDVYSLGCMLHESLTGTPPFAETEPREILRRQLEDDPRPPSLYIEACPAELEALVLQMLSKRREERPPQMGEVAHLLARLARCAPGGTHAVHLAEGETPAPRLHRPRLTGRDDVLRTFERTRSRLDAGQGGLVFFGGESGIGKTFVLTEITRRASLRRARVVTGECPPLAVGERSEVAAPLRPFTSLLQATADACVERAETVLPMLREWLGVLAPFEPSLRRIDETKSSREPVDLPPGAARDRLFAALRASLVALSADRPLLLALDDLHWADELTLSFLSSLGSALFDAHPILIVGAYRAEEMPLALTRLVATEGVTRLRLGQLRTAEIQKIVGDMLGEEAPPAGLVQHVLTVSEGNPFFAAEYLRVLVADGAMTRRRGFWQVNVEAFRARAYSANLEAVIARRLTYVPAEVRAVLQAGAVIGRTFDLATLEASMEPGVSLVPILDVAREKELIEQLSGGYRFLHDKVRQVAYESIDAAGRASLHRRVALASEKLEVGTSDRYEPCARIAHHFRCAGMLDRALVYLDRAGEAAIATFAYREGISFLEAALEMRARLGLDEPVAHARLRRRIADAFQGLGELAPSETHLVAAAAKLGYPVPRDKIRMAAGLVRQVAVQAAHRLLPRLWDRVADVRLEEAARVYDRLQQVNFYRGEGLPIFYCGLLTLNIAELVAPSAELATAYANAHAVAGVVPARRLSEAYLERAIAALRGRPDPVVESYLLTLTGVYRVGCGQWTMAKLALERALALAKDLGFARRAEEVDGALAELGYLHGDLEGAFRFATDQFESGGRGDAQTRCWGLLARAQVLLVREEMPRAREDIERAVALLPTLGRPERIWAHGLCARAALRAGDLRAATTAADQAAARIAEAPPVAHYCLEAYAAVTEVRLAVLAKERSSRARRNAARACRAQFHAARIFPIAAPSCWLHRGAWQWLEGRRDAAITIFERALERAASLGMPREAMLAHQVLGWVARPSDASAAHHARRASELATELGIAVPPRPVGWP
jgi:serine/threonine protein kinase/tetratricopeptide (TPR) repeat protein